MHLLKDAHFFYFVDFQSIESFVEKEQDLPILNLMKTPLLGNAGVYYFYSLWVHVKNALLVESPIIRGHLKKIPGPPLLRSYRSMDVREVFFDNPGKHISEKHESSVGSGFFL